MLWTKWIKQRTDPAGKKRPRVSVGGEDEENNNDPEYGRKTGRKNSFSSGSGKKKEGSGP